MTSWPPSGAAIIRQAREERFTRTAVAWKILITGLELEIEFVTILLLAILKSIFGTDILFIGVPTLDLLGYPFAETLSILLSASIALSLFQIIGSKHPNRRQIGN